MADTRGWGDQRIEIIVGNLLRIGVTTAAAIVSFGALIYLVRHGLSPVDYSSFRGEPADLRHVSGILHYTFGLRARGIMQLGLLVLIATPVARVAFSIFGFAKEKDRLYVGFTIFVFLILLYSLIGSAYV